MVDIVILLLLAVAIVNYKLNTDVAYPPFIYSLIWIAVLFVHSVAVKADLFEASQLSGYTMIIFTVGVIFFSFGGFISHTMFSGHSPEREAFEIRLNKFVDILLFLVPIVFLPLYIQKTVMLANESGIDNFLLGLKIQQLEGKDIEAYGYLRYIGFLSIFNAAFRFFLVQRHVKSERYKYYVSLLIAVIYVFSTLGRAALLVLLVLLLGIKMIMAKIKIRDYAYGFLAFIAFYGALAVVLGKGGSLEATYSENLRDITIIFFQYAGGPLYAFDNFINSNFELSFGEHTGRFFYALFYKMGITDTPPVDLVLPFVYVPYPSNVYTVYFPYVKDFGVIVSFFIIALMGFVHSHIYYRAKTGSYIYVLFYSMFLYPLIMSFFVDQYLSLLAQWLFFAILVITTAHFMKSSAPEMKRNEDTVAGHNNR